MQDQLTFRSVETIYIPRFLWIRTSMIVQITFN